MVEVTPGASKQLDITVQTALAEEVTVTATKREQTILDVPFSVAAPTEEVLRLRGVEDIEGVAANVAGLTVQNLGPGQSQVAMRGVSAGQIVRDQPGVKEQVGVYLDESVISLSLFTPDIDLFDIEPRRGAAGPAGNVVRLRFAERNGPVHHQPAGARCRDGFAELGLSFVDGGSPGRRRQARRQRCPWARRRRSASRRYYNRIAGFIDAVQPDLSVDDNVNDGFRSGFRAAVKFAPNERTAITPRFVYQQVKMDGWNRIDDYNILANPFTTTRPAVTLGERQQFIQLQEDFTDDFVLADVLIEQTSATWCLTSITLVHLSGRPGGPRRGRPDVQHHRRIRRTSRERLHARRAAERRNHCQRLVARGARLRRAPIRFPWVAGGFFSHTGRDYGQDLPVIGFEALTGTPTAGLRAPRDTLFFSDLSYSLNQFALFGEGTFTVTPRFSVTGGLRYYNFSEEKEQIFDGIFGNNDNGISLVSQPGSTDADGLAPRVIASYKLTDAANLNAPGLTGLPAGWNQRSAQRAALHATGSRYVRRPRHVGRRDRLELRGRHQVEGARWSWRVRCECVLHGHQRPSGDSDGRLVLITCRFSTYQMPEAPVSRSSSKRRRTAISISPCQRASTTPSCDPR